jgi:hypothetical protein
MAGHGNGSGSGAWPAGGNGGRIGNGGSALPDATRAAMESRFGGDFSNVRVLNNSCVATAMGAQAYAQGTDIHFATGAYQPHTREGQQLIAHELTHVVQQGGQ